MEKVFKTHNQQLLILRRKGLVVPKNGIPKRVLERENYYKIINGYKDLFLHSRKTSTTTERFKSSSTFLELQALYDFDNEIKMIFLKRILRIENEIKNKIAHVFSEKYGHDNYLKIANFNCGSNNENLHYVMRLIKDLHSDIARSIGKKESITHYVSQYGYVPLWVLVSILTFGRMGIFYRNMLQPDRQAVSAQYRISDRDLDTMIKTLTLLRNGCAHDERIYNFRSESSIRTNRYHRGLGIPVRASGPIYGRQDLYSVIIILKFFMKKIEFHKLLTEIKHAINELMKNLYTITTTDVLRQMGFPSNWEDIKSL